MSFNGTDLKKKTTCEITCEFEFGNLLSKHHQTIKNDAMINLFTATAISADVPSSYLFHKSFITRMLAWLTENRIYERSHGLITLL